MPCICQPNSPPSRTGPPSRLRSWHSTQHVAWKSSLQPSLLFCGFVYAAHPQFTHHQSPDSQEYHHQGPCRWCRSLLFSSKLAPAVWTARHQCRHHAAQGSWTAHSTRGGLRKGKSWGWIIIIIRPPHFSVGLSLPRPAHATAPAIFT